MRLAAAALALLLVGLMAACSGPSVTYRYRLTVEVDTPTGPRTGSSVIETTTVDRTGAKGLLPESRMLSSRVRVEAVFVDLGGGRNLLAILARGPRGDEGVDFDWLVPSVLGIPRGAEGFGRLSAAKGRHDVPAHLLPTLVTFSDLNDPKSARVVRPDGVGQAFGTGFRFRGAWIEMVDVGWWPDNATGLAGRSVSHDIDKRMSWVGQVRGYLNGKSACDPRVGLCLHVGHFRKN